MRPRPLMIYLVGMDIVLMTLGFLMFSTQMTYDAQFWNVWPSGGLINQLYEAPNTSAVVNGTNQGWCLYESRDYYSFWGFWRGIDQICNASTGLVDTVPGPWALVFWLSNRHCGSRSLNGLIAGSYPLVSTLIFFTLSGLTGAVALGLWVGHHIRGWSKIAFTTVFISSKISFLLGVVMYLLAVHNHNLSFADNMPGVLSGQLTALLVFYLVAMVGNSVIVCLANPFSYYDTL